MLLDPRTRVSIWRQCEKDVPVCIESPAQVCEVFYDFQEETKGESIRCIERVEECIFKVILNEGNQLIGASVTVMEIYEELFYEGSCRLRQMRMDSI